jgi:dTDP-4-amino-4,6-dideoxygalactose transaminase
VTSISTTYEHRCVVPDLPPVVDFLPFIQAAQTAGWFTNFGPLARRLEAFLARDFGFPGEVCVSASSATAGLSAALLALGRPGPVLAPAFTFPASAGAVRAAGLDVLVMDVSERTWAIDAGDLDRALRSANAETVMLVSPFGLPQDFSEQIAVCRRHAVAVVIDSAAGLGAARSERSAAPDVIEVFSMHATKPFGIGEGGAVFAHAHCEEAIRAALNFSLQAPNRSDLPAWGFNGKMSEFHAGVGLAQLNRFPLRLVGRQAFAARYIAQLDEIGGVVFAESAKSAPWQVFPALLPSKASREQAIAFAAEAGLEIRRYYDPSLSQWPGLRTIGACTTSEALADRMCALPVRGDATGTEADLIINTAVRAIRKAVGAS